LNANEDKIKADKFALIYEFNNASPLFTRVASKFIENGEPEKALPILEDGLQNFRNYPTAIILYSLALAMVGKKEEAYNTIEKISDLFNFGETIKYYKARIDSIKESDNQFNYNYSPEKFDEDKPPLKTENLLTQSETTLDVDDDLEELAERLSTASIPLINEYDEPPAAAVNTSDKDMFPGKSLVSETLAKIYFNQGNFNEALSIYETLIEIQPEKSEYYQNQIDRINEQKNK
jgi:tetratricopeptide (TPR) repeat protein